MIQEGGSHILEYLLVVIRNEKTQPINECCIFSLERFIFAIAITILLMSGMTVVSAATITVDDSGGADYTIIQYAIDNASTGDTILVNSGTYYENVIVNKLLVLMGNDTGGGYPVINSSFNEAISVNANGSTIQGFTIIGGTVFGIQVSSSNNTIRNNTVSDSIAGIFVLNSNNTIIENNVSNNSFGGIYLDDFSNNNIVNSNIANNNTRGIYIDNSENNIISNNIVNNNADNGIYFDTSNNNTLNSNIVNSNDDGIYIYQSDNTTITNSITNNNTNGIFLDYSNNNTLSNNTANLNDDGIKIVRSDNNILTGNEAINNDFGISLIYSNYTIVTSNVANLNNYVGFSFGLSFNNTFSNNTASLNILYGVNIDYSSNNTFNNNTANLNNDGFSLYSSFNNILANNSAEQNNDNGFYLRESDNNTLNGNNVNSNNGFGIFVYYSSNNMFYDNNMTANKYNFDVYGWSYSQFNHSIDTSNKVDGKSVYYLKNIMDTVYAPPSSIGTFYCINCTNVTVKDATLENNGAGLFFWNTTNSTIQNVTTMNNYNGIFLSSSNKILVNEITSTSNFQKGLKLASSTDITINSSNISNNVKGVALYSSNNNSLNNNYITNNDGGIFLEDSCFNTLAHNNVSNNGDGIVLSSSMYETNNNTLTNNTVNSNSRYGIVFSSSTNNTLNGNVMRANLYNLFVEIIEDSALLNEIDKSNLVDDKPVYYLNNIRDVIYNSSTNAGIVYCIDCENVTIKDLIFKNNSAGIFFWNTSNSSILNVTAENNMYGILLFTSSKNIISQVNTSNNYIGSILYNSNNNTLNGSTVINNEIGIGLMSQDNIIYNNYFNNDINAIDDGNNTWNITKTASLNILGNPWLGGNYWSDYSGNDTDLDGLGDTLLPFNSSNNIVNGGDYLPLIDEIPPSGITGLKVSATTSTSINWTWINPVDPDFIKNMIYINGVFRENITSPINHSLVSGLSANTQYTISIQTVDISGNINSTWVNLTSKTDAVTSTSNGGGTIIDNDEDGVEENTATVTATETSSPQVHEKKILATIENKTVQPTSEKSESGLQTWLLLMGGSVIGTASFVKRNAIQAFINKIIKGL